MLFLEIFNDEIFGLKNKFESHKMQNKAGTFWNILNNLVLWLTIIQQSVFDD